MKNLMTVTIAVLGVAGCAIAGPVNIDPDAFAAGTTLTSAFAAATLTSNQIGANVQFLSATNDIIGRNPSAQPVGQISTPSTGVLSFAWNESAGGNQRFTEWAEIVMRFRADFSANANSVSIDILGNNSFDFGYLEAYRSDNTLIQRVNSANVTAGNFQTLTINSGTFNIAYIISSGIGGETVGLDNLNANLIPLPTGAAMAMVGMGLIGVRRRR
ncbi:MAG: hypothetical protein IH985_04465 [Planctomycetes bacterium]|nr:hypothetical protein [Planctomycetota bacterium]